MQTYQGKRYGKAMMLENGVVSWTFETIERVYLIEDEELHNGSEVFSRFLRDAEVKSLLTPFSDESP